MYFLTKFPSFNRFSQPAHPVRTISTHSESIRAVACDESQFYSASVDKTICIWNKFTHELLHQLHGHDKGVRCLFIKDDKLYSGSEDHTIIIWNKYVS